VSDKFNWQLSIVNAGPTLSVVPSFGLLILARIEPMPLVCERCLRVNPPEAAYCYHDGAALAGRAGGPINAGAAAFPGQFVFPNGLACRNFDQLAMACQQNWKDAINLLKQGYLGSFFGGMGRVDLAMAAQEAAKFPDADRGLDQLLSKLPTQALQEPKLQAGPPEINLGQIKIGADRTSELHLTNVGMRLLYGTITSDCKWLLIGDPPGHTEKLFQFSADMVIPVQVRGQHLRAGSKPLEGNLTIDCNGGLVTVKFKADVPITPYDGGMFAGAVTPRQIAEKAKANPREAAPLFERGDVAKWYASNGWPYPVQGPIMPGVGAIQQFFEALGVAKAPKIDIVPKLLDLQGAVGKTIEAKVEVTTPDRKVVYGWANSDQHWLEVGKTKLTGKTATIPLTIRIPSPCPPTLTAKLHVIGNGGQKCDVSVRVAVAGGKAGVVLDTPHDVLEVIEEEETPMVLTIADTPPVVAIVEEEAPVVATVAAVQEAVQTAPPPPAVVEESPFAVDDVAISKSDAPQPKQSSLAVRLILHTIPLALLCFTCLGVMAADVLRAYFGGGAGGGGGGGADDVDLRPYVKLVFDEGRLDAVCTDSMNWAVHKIDPTDNNVASVKLNWYANGVGNSIVAKIDDKENVFGFGGIWARDDGIPKNEGKYGGKKRTYEFPKGIFVTQTVTIEPGELREVGPNEHKRILNMCLARYKITNKDTKPHKVGLRVLMDTCIGDNDGVPFTLPGVNELVSTNKRFDGAEVPDFIQVLENPDLSKPGTVLQLNLRVAKELEVPSRFLLTRYPGKVDKKHQKWDVPIEPIKRDVTDKGDSSVVLYWEEKTLDPGKSREVGFTYGIGNVSIAANKLGLTVGGAMHKGGELTVVALVSDSNAKTVTLQVPANLELIEPKSPTQKVTTPRDGRPTAVTWRVRAIDAATNDVSVATDNNLKASRRVRISLKSLFN
jgi:hypothetical protein